MKVKKIPTRTCVGCQQAKEKSDLIRIVRTPGGDVVFDRSGKAGGRGAYICADLDCFKQAVKKKALSRALAREIGTQRLEELGEEIKQEISRSKAD